MRSYEACLRKGSTCAVLGRPHDVLYPYVSLVNTVNHIDYEIRRIRTEERILS